MMVIERSYETFAIEWKGGSRWSGYVSAAEAQAVIDRSSRGAGIVRTVFKVRFSPERAHLYAPGIGDEVLSDAAAAVYEALRVRTGSAAG